MISSHYAEPLDRKIIAAVVLRSGPTADSAAIGKLSAGEAFAMLDNSLGWAWGYAGNDRRVGYVPAAAVGAP